MTKYSQKANINATNSELDAKEIVHHVKFDDYPFADDPFENLDRLTDAQIYDIIEQYVAIKVDRMSTQDLIDYVTQDLTDWYSDFTPDELKDTISDNDEELYDELVDNVTQQYAKQDVNNPYNIPTRF